MGALLIGRESRLGSFSMGGEGACLVTIDIWSQFLATLVYHSLVVTEAYTQAYCLLYPPRYRVSNFWGGEYNLLF